LRGNPSARPNWISEAKAHTRIVDDKIADRIDGDVAGPFEGTYVELFALIDIIGC
jgi:hypothetical protein